MLYRNYIRRPDARKGRGDTGLLNCLLKHVVGKLVSGGGEGLLRQHNKKLNSLLAHVIMVSCLVTFAEASSNTSVWKEYYEYSPEYKNDKIKVLEGDEVVRKHFKANLKFYISGWKSDVDNRVKKAHARGDMSANRRTCPPYYLSKRAWDGLNEYWESDIFSKMSEINTENALMSDIRHCSGAKPFDQRYEEMEEKLEKPLSILEKFDASYKKKGRLWSVLWRRAIIRMHHHL